MQLKVVHGQVEIVRRGGAGLDRAKALEAYELAHQSGARLGWIQGASLSLEVNQHDLVRRVMCRGL